MIKHVVSLSSGKDSVATLIIALNRFGRDAVTPIFCDTGNEHVIVHEHLEYLERTLGIQVVRLRANFGDEIAGKRLFISRDRRTGREYDAAPVFDVDGNPVPKRDDRGNIVMKKVRRDGVVVMEPVQKTKKVGGGRRIRWSNKAKRRALSALYPTGNPFLDLCLWKGRFPSRRAQFCTEELKRNIAVEYQLSLMERGHTVVSWQGVRRDESLNRRDAKRFERVGPRFYIYRPIVDWNAPQVFASIKAQKLEYNPLYLQGFSRVGCMPCINCSKEEVRTIMARAPEHLDEKAHWEALVSMCSKRGFSTFFYKELHKNTGIMDRRVHRMNNIDAVKEWAKTTRGGRQYDLLQDVDEPSVCSSAYGLCE